MKRVHVYLSGRHRLVLHPDGGMEAEWRDCAEDEWFVEDAQDAPNDRVCAMVLQQAIDLLLAQVAKLNG